jgi:hypothetical protein
MPLLSPGTFFFPPRHMSATHPHPRKKYPLRASFHHLQTSCAAGTFALLCNVYVAGTNFWFRLMKLSFQNVSVHVCLLCFFKENTKFTNHIECPGSDLILGIVISYIKLLRDIFPPYYTSRHINIAISQLHEKLQNLTMKNYNIILFLSLKSLTISFFKEKPS